jgi:5'-3' exonuclease
MTFLVGNDFLPHLPSLDISEGAFDRLFNTYKSMLGASFAQGNIEAGYLTENGSIRDFKRLETFLMVRESANVFIMYIFSVSVLSHLSSIEQIFSMCALFGYLISNLLLFANF